MKIDTFQTDSCVATCFFKSLLKSRGIEYRDSNSYGRKSEPDIKTINLFEYFSTVKKIDQ